MTIIFLLSNQQALTSKNTSDNFIKNTANVVSYLNNNVNTSFIIDNYTFIIRKTAHFTLYLILGLLVYNVCKDNKKRIIISLFICIFYACTDEFHQLFVIGRSCEIRDVIIDSIGSFIGIVIYNYIYRKRHID